MHKRYLTKLPLPSALLAQFKQLQLPIIFHMTVIPIFLSHSTIYDFNNSNFKSYILHFNKPIAQYFKWALGFSSHVQLWQKLHFQVMVTFLTCHKIQCKVPKVSLTSITSIYLLKKSNLIWGTCMFNMQPLPPTKRSNVPECPTNVAAARIHWQSWFREWAWCVQGTEAKVVFW